LGHSISSRHSQSCCFSPVSPSLMPFMILTHQTHLKVRRSHKYVVRLQACFKLSWPLLAIYPRNLNGSPH
jgi:hypothetical protein